MRFGLQLHDAATMTRRAVQAEEIGYSVVTVPDHLGLTRPWPAIGALAAATSSISIGTLTLNAEFHNHTMVLENVATVQELSAGRLELGLGAGHMQREFDMAGLPFRPLAKRVRRLEALIEQLPDDIPLLIGGNSDTLLDLAARKADIVGFTGFGVRENVPRPTHFDRNGLADRVEFVRTAARERQAALEFHALIQAVYIDRPVEERHSGSPFVLAGSIDEVIEQLGRLEADYGITYVTVFADERGAGFDEVVRHLSH